MSGSFHANLSFLALQVLRRFTMTPNYFCIFWWFFPIWRGIHLLYLNKILFRLPKNDVNQNWLKMAWFWRRFLKIFSFNIKHLTSPPPPSLLSPFLKPGEHGLKTGGPWASSLTWVTLVHVEIQYAFHFHLPHLTLGGPWYHIINLRLFHIRKHSCKIQLFWFIVLIKE
jgi:hypothetical protein